PARHPPSLTLFPYTTLFRSSAEEALCVRVRGQQARQLARQLTAAALNCVVSGKPADCLGSSISDLFARCNTGCAVSVGAASGPRSEEHTSELQSRFDLVCRL